MKNISRWFLTGEIIAAVLASLSWHGVGLAQSYSIRPTCSPNGQCRVRPETFGYNDTNWRQWPVQPRPEQRNPGSVGASVLPTPPAVPERAYPKAESLPAKPSVEGSGTILPEGVLPGGGRSPDLIKPPAGATAPDGLGPISPLSPVPGLPAPQGLMDIPGNLSPAPQPESRPKSDTERGAPPAPSTEPIKPGDVTPKPALPDLSLPALPAPVSPDTAKPKSQGEDLLKPKAPIKSEPELDLLPVPLPTEPVPAKPKQSGLKPRRSPRDVADTGSATPSGKPDSLLQANWTAALEPEQVKRELRQTGFEEETPAASNPQRRALDGYCVVELIDKEQWHAGKPEFSVDYQGQRFWFSSEAARRKFETSPEKYAPAGGGNDVVAGIEDNRDMPGCVQYSAVWRGRLYLFASSANMAAFQQDPARYGGAPNRSRQVPSPVDPM